VRLLVLGLELMEIIHSQHTVVLRKRRQARTLHDVRQPRPHQRKENRWNCKRSVPSIDMMNMSMNKNKKMKINGMVEAAVDG